MKHQGVDSSEYAKEPKVEWWGYLHANGKPQLKRWYGDHKDYTEDCLDNPFVIKVVRPFEAASHEAAMIELCVRLGLQPRDETEALAS